MPLSSALIVEPREHPASFASIRNVRENLGPEIPIIWFVVIQFVVVYKISPKHYLFVTCAKDNLYYASYIWLAEIS